MLLAVGVSAVHYRPNRCVVARTRSSLMIPSGAGSDDAKVRACEQARSRRRNRWFELLFVACVEAVDGLSLQGDGGGDQGVVAECGHGLEVAGDATASMCKSYGSEASGDLLFDLGHANFALATIILERSVGAPGKAQNVFPLNDETFMEVLGVGLGDRPALALLSRRHFGHLIASSVEHCHVASCDALVVSHGQPLLRALDDLSPSDQQQLAHLACPGISVAVDHGLQFSEQVGAADLVLALGVGETGSPAVMDDDAVSGDDADGVDRIAAAVPAQTLDGDGPAGADMDPLVLRSTRNEVSSTRSTGRSRSLPMAAASQGSRAWCRRETKPSRVASESSRPVIAWIMAAVRWSETIWAQSRCTK